MTQELEAKREALVHQMLAIRCMRRGALSEQYVARTRKGKPTGEYRGPYYVLSRRQGGRTVSQRIDPGEVEQVREDLDHYEAFMQLCDEFAEVTQQLGQHERRQGTAHDTLKKTLKSPRKLRRK